MAGFKRYQSVKSLRIENKFAESKEVAEVNPTKKDLFNRIEKFRNDIKWGNGYIAKDERRTPKNKIQIIPLKS